MSPEPESGNERGRGAPQSRVPSPGEELGGTRPSGLVRGAIRVLAGVVVVGLVIVAVPDLGGIRRRLEGAAIGWVAAGAALEAASVAAFAVAFHRMFVRDLSWRNSASLAATGQGVNVLVPAGGTGGLAAIAVVMVRLGLPRQYVVSRMVAVFVVAEAATNVALVIVGGLGVGSGALPGHAPWEETFVPGVLAVAVCLALAAVVGRSTGPRSHARGRTGRMLAAVAEPLRDGLRTSGRLVRGRDPLLLLGAAGFVLLDLAALAASFRAVSDRGLPLGTLLLGYTLGQIGSVIPLPGTTEGGLLGVLVLYGAPVGAAASAIVVFRAIQIFIPLGLGLIGAVGVRGMLGPDLTRRDGELALQGPQDPR